MMTYMKCINLAAGELWSKTDGGSDDFVWNASPLGETAKNVLLCYFFYQGEGGRKDSFIGVCNRYIFLKQDVGQW